MINKIYNRCHEIDRKIEFLTINFYINKYIQNMQQNILNKDFPNNWCRSNVAEYTIQLLRLSKSFPM